MSTFQTFSVHVLVTISHVHCDDRIVWCQEQTKFYTKYKPSWGYAAILILYKHTMQGVRGDTNSYIENGIYEILYKPGRGYEAILIPI